MKEGKKRGGQKKMVYMGHEMQQVLLKVPHIIQFKQRAEKEGLSLVEFMFLEMLCNHNEYQNKQNESTN